MPRPAQIVLSLLLAGPMAFSLRKDGFQFLDIRVRLSTGQGAYFFRSGASVGPARTPRTRSAELQKRDLEAQVEGSRP